MNEVENKRIGRKGVQALKKPKDRDRDRDRIGGNRVKALKTLKDRDRDRIGGNRVKALKKPKDRDRKRKKRTKKSPKTKHKKQ